MPLGIYSGHSGQSSGRRAWREQPMVMEPISVMKAKDIAGKKGLKPGRVKGTNGIQFTKGGNSRLEVIGWDEFEKTLNTKKLQIYESGGWMKIMAKKR